MSLPDAASIARIGTDSNLPDKLDRSMSKLTIPAAEFSVIYGSPATGIDRFLLPRQSRDFRLAKRRQNGPVQGLHLRPRNGEARRIGECAFWRRESTAVSPVRWPVVSVRNFSFRSGEFARVA